MGGPGERGQRTGALTCPWAVFEIGGQALFGDLMALGALNAIAGTGLKCPENVSLIGFHDLPELDHIRPPLTTIREPGEELGRIVAEMTLAIVNRPAKPPPSRRLAPILMVRGSTGPPPRLIAGLRGSGGREKIKR